jgi:hypothetical protein
VRIPAVLIDLEGAEAGEFKSQGEMERHVPVKHRDGRVGRRVFVRSGWARGCWAYVQKDPVQWCDPPCNRCGRDKDHPIHRGHDVDNDGNVIEKAEPNTGAKL